MPVNGLNYKIKNICLSVHLFTIANFSFKFIYLHG